MSKALCTFAEGPMQALQEVALPGMRDFADRHGYFLKVPTPAEARLVAGGPARPAAWYKVPVIGSLLDEYDEVLWLDADVFVWDCSNDPADTVSAPCWGAMVMHSTDCGRVPNSGVWLVRRHAAGLLRDLWGMTQHIHSGWWEQAALIERLGMLHHPLTVSSQPNQLFRGTYWLDEGFNAVPTHDNWPTKRPRFLHASGMSMENRLEYFHRWQRGDL